VPENKIYKPIRRSDLLVREVENENIIYDHTNNAVHSLNITAKFIWDCCDGSRNLSEIAKEITERFNIDADTAFKDVEGTVKEFKEKHLLQEHTSGKTS
jgi:hypothetical protein